MVGEINFLEEYTKAHDSKDYDDAIEIYTSFIDDTNNTDNKEKLAEAYYYRGLSYAQLGDIDNALKDIQKSDDLAFDKAKIYCARGIAYAHEGNNDAALKNFARAKNINEDYAEIYYRRGIAFYYKYNYKEAIKEFEKAIEKHKEYLKESYYYTGLSYAQLGDTDNGLENIEKADKLVFDKAKIYCSYGIAYAHVGNNKKAISNFDKAIYLDKNYAEAYYRRGLTYYYDGKHNNAVSDFEIAIDKGYNTYALFYHLYLLISEKKKCCEAYKKLVLKIQELISKIFEKSIVKKEDTSITRLYKYTKINTNTLSLISNNEIYLSNPDNFNDPADPPIKILRDDIKNKNKNHFSELIDRIKIACLTIDNNNILMWAHYGDKHQGMCIEYDISKLEDSKVIFKHINYYMEIENSNNEIKNSHINYKISLLDTLAVKDNDWKYENEYRIIKYTAKASKNGVRIVLPIKAIYLGTKTSEEDRKLIKKIIDGKEIKLYKFNFDKKDILKIVSEEIKY